MSKAVTDGTYASTMIADGATADGRVAIIRNRDAISNDVAESASHSTFRLLPANVCTSDVATG